MCNALCECLKCPGKVVCCCCSCACKMLLSILCSGIILLIIIGLIVYFTVFYNKDSGTPTTENVAETIQNSQLTFRDYFKSLQKD